MTLLCRQGNFIFMALGDINTIFGKKKVFLFFIYYEIKQKKMYSNFLFL